MRSYRYLKTEGVQEAHTGLDPEKAYISWNGDDDHYNEEEEEEEEERRRKGKRMRIWKKRR